VHVTPLETRLKRLRRFNAWVKANDPRLAVEATEAAHAALETEAFEVARDPADLERDVMRESLILRSTRPVLAIKENAVQLVFVDAEDRETWKERLDKAEVRKALDRAIRAVGRINLAGSEFAWVGTGWLVAENVLVTNRHVAHAFAQQNGASLVFKTGDGGPIGADVDFLQEIDNPATLAFTLARPLHIEDEGGPDLAFFEVEHASGGGPLAQPLPLADEKKILATQNAAVIGYPAYDSRIPELDLMERIFQKVYNKKRLAPGAVTAIESERILHNCSTLGGNSGSAIVDFVTGEALGLHFSGTFLTTNYAVRADLVARRLEEVRSGRMRRETRAASPAERAGAASAAPIAPAQHIGATLPGGTDSATITLPLTITVTIGAPMAAPAPTSLPRTETGGGEVEGEEAVAADYRGRTGYEADFLGPDAQVPLPAVMRDGGDVLDFAVEGKTQTELKYIHYSVVMNRSRRMCFFSACNIDGNQSRKSARVGWKWDPRIPKTHQIMNECYGNPPKFSRGHMTRREDPGWGDKKTAQRGNEDSMHVTNVTPQMQAFNAPIWLALEDYALQHAREDAMKISVFTGPYFSEQDPEMYGVLIPRAFWKVIAFIHDDTDRLCATGYEMGQEKTLRPAEEFVFGAFTSPQLQVATQVPIRAIEARAGLSFGTLANRDPLGGAEESVAVERVALQALEQIRFV
jgi:endonuclease G